MNNNELTVLNTRIPFDLRTRFKAFCADNNLKLQEGAAAAIRQWLNSQKQGGEAA